MPSAFPASLLDAVLGLVLGPVAPAAGSRLSIEGLATRPAADGALELGVGKLAAQALRLGSQPFVLEAGQVTVHELVATLRGEAGGLALAAAQARSIALKDVKIFGPLDADGVPACDWMLGPLAAAEGTVRARIVDAHLLFDADVTVPIRHGGVAFKDATVEHVGPDSRMGVSRMGVYVDAPNGRSYLYQFPSTPVAGVEFEKRGAMLGPWVTHRGSLQLQPFGEWLLRQAGGLQGVGITEQARQLFDRTAVTGEVQLSDGRFAGVGVAAEFAGSASGSNKVRVQAQAVGRGLTLEMPLLALRALTRRIGALQLHAEEVVGALTLRLTNEGGHVRFVFEIGELRMSGVRLQPAGA